MKKGQGLSITTIVVAAIALLILVVLVAVFTGQFGGFTLGVQDCQAKAGACYDSCNDPGAQSSGNTALLPGRTSCSKIPKVDGEGNQVCCVNPTGNQ